MLLTFECRIILAKNDSNCNIYAIDNEIESKLFNIQLTLFSISWTLDSLIVQGLRDCMFVFLYLYE